MSANDDGREFIISVIKKVLENREDLSLNDSCINQIAVRMLLTTPASQIMSELQTLRQKCADDVHHLQLKKSIELLALVTHEIDYQAFSRDVN